MINIGKFIGKFVRNSSQREIDKLKLIVKKINDLEANTKEIPDKNFPSKTAEFKEKKTLPQNKKDTVDVDSLKINVRDITETDRTDRKIKKEQI